MISNFAAQNPIRSGALPPNPRSISGQKKRLGAACLWALGEHMTHAERHHTELRPAGWIATWKRLCMVTALNC